ncbi:MarR family winged helix-turn-helix transcriptional regulator [Rummeliibacillus suwonensis]|uniref:MarR family winged helix-turn-helix transcriptional regulator n=1 Tax=Rummeliibacillus suwonensis TaxID=1306154 RepID=UPI001AB00D80|nr:MarR family transcriptional regulator [Rummeliibacillus suwonensis]MBO2534509.1 MarR family transcriptional regulator [Rummeliibacillus suwonensis]
MQTEQNYLDNQLCFLLYVSSKEIIKKYTFYLKEYDLTYTGYIVLLAINCDEQVNIKELGNRVFLDSGTLTPLLKKLELKGYISRERSKKDERNLMVQLTEQGKRVQKELPCISEKVFEKTNMTKEEFFQTKTTLEKIIHSFRS